MMEQLKLPDLVYYKVGESQLEISEMAQLETPNFYIIKSYGKFIGIEVVALSAILVMENIDYRQAGQLKAYARTRNKHIYYLADITIG